MLYVEMDEAGGVRYLLCSPDLNYRPLRADKPAVEVFLDRPECVWITRALRAHDSERHGFFHFGGFEPHGIRNLYQCLVPRGSTSPRELLFLLLFLEGIQSDSQLIIFFLQQFVFSKKRYYLQLNIFHRLESFEVHPSHVDRAGFL